MGIEAEAEGMLLTKVVVVDVVVTVAWVKLLHFVLDLELGGYKVILSVLSSRDKSYMYVPHRPAQVKQRREAHRARPRWRRGEKIGSKAWLCSSVFLKHSKRNWYRECRSLKQAEEKQKERALRLLT